MAFHQSIVYTITFIWWTAMNNEQFVMFFSQNVNDIHDFVKNTNNKLVK